MPIWSRHAKSPLTGQQASGGKPSNPSVPDVQVRGNAQATVPPRQVTADEVGQRKPGAHYSAESNTAQEQLQRFVGVGSLTAPLALRQVTRWSTSSQAEVSSHDIAAARPSCHSIGTRFARQAAQQCAAMRRCA